MAERSCTSDDMQSPCSNISQSMIEENVSLVKEPNAVVVADDFGHDQMNSLRSIIFRSALCAGGSSGF